MLPPDVCTVCHATIEITDFLYHSNRHIYCITCYNRLYQRAVRFLMRRRDYPTTRLYLIDHLTTERPAIAA
jgi:hypothetical protein